MFEMKNEMVIWAFSKIKALNLINPYYINYLPILLLAVLFANFGHKSYKTGKRINCKILFSCQG